MVFFSRFTYLLLRSLSIVDAALEKAAGKQAALIHFRTRLSPPRRYSAHSWSLSPAALLPLTCLSSRLRVWDRRFSTPLIEIFHCFCCCCCVYDWIPRFSLTIRDKWMWVSLHMRNTRFEIGTKRLKASVNEDITSWKNVQLSDRQICLIYWDLG